MVTYPNDMHNEAWTSLAGEMADCDVRLIPGQGETSIGFYLGTRLLFHVKVRGNYPTVSEVMSRPEYDERFRCVLQAVEEDAERHFKETGQRLVE